MTLATRSEATAKAASAREASRGMGAVTTDQKNDALERIAAATGGRVVEPDEIEEVFASIRDRSARIPDDIREPLWDSKLIFVLFALIISSEWVLRKAFGLM